MQGAFRGDRAEQASTCCAEERRGCCGGGESSAEHATASDSGCCGESGEESPGGNHDCCAACKDRNPQMPPAVAVPDLTPELDAVATMLLADALAALPAAGTSPDALARDTGPPPRPAGRSALALHSILVI